MEQELRKLEMIQTKERLNNVYSVDDEGPGGAHHMYLITKNDDSEEMERRLECINFQKGPRKEEGSISGVIDSDLLEIVRDRLKSFQSGPFSSEYNAKALEGVEMALNALNQRVEDRIKRDVLGKNVK